MINNNSIYLVWELLYSEKVFFFPSLETKSKYDYNCVDDGNYHRMPNSSVSHDYGENV